MQLFPRSLVCLDTLEVQLNDNIAAIMDLISQLHEFNTDEIYFN